MSGRIPSWFHHVLPQRAVSALTYRAARWRRVPFRRVLMSWYVRYFGVDMSEAEHAGLEAYPDFNSFFTRALRPGVRTLPNDPAAVCCPVDGAVSQIGRIERTTLLQAKGHTYSLRELLGGKTEHVDEFRDGCFATLYLAPGDYHRIHMPRDGQLREMIHVPGRLFGVSRPCVAHIPRLFARNERVVCLFESDVGPMAVILVGTINVGSIETVWAGEVTPPSVPRVTQFYYEPDNGHTPKLARGDELGRFNLGSTVIVLFGKDRVQWDPQLAPEARVRLGQAIGTALRPPRS